MAQILSFEDPKWELVKAHYEKAYKIRFKRRPTEAEINDLFEKMAKLETYEREHFFLKPGLKGRFKL